MAGNDDLEKVLSSLRRELEERARVKREEQDLIDNKRGYIDRVKVLADNILGRRGNKVKELDCKLVSEKEILDMIRKVDELKVGINNANPEFLALIEQEVRIIERNLEGIRVKCDNIGIFDRSKRRADMIIGALAIAAASFFTGYNLYRPLNTRDVPFIMDEKEEITRDFRTKNYAKDFEESSKEWIPSQKSIEYFTRLVKSQNSALEQFTGSLAVYHMNRDRLFEDVSTNDERITSEIQLIQTVRRLRDDYERLRSIIDSPTPVLDRIDSLESQVRILEEERQKLYSSASQASGTTITTPEELSEVLRVYKAINDRDNELIRFMHEKIGTTGEQQDNTSQQSISEVIPNYVNSLEARLRSLQEANDLLVRTVDMQMEGTRLALKLIESYERESSNNLLGMSTEELTEFRTKLEEYNTFLNEINRQNSAITPEDNSTTIEGAQNNTSYEYKLETNTDPNRELSEPHKTQLRELEERVNRMNAQRDEIVRLVSELAVRIRNNLDNSSQQGTTRQESGNNDQQSIPFGRERIEECIVEERARDLRNTDERGRIVFNVEEYGPEFESYRVRMASAEADNSQVRIPFYSLDNLFESSHNNHKIYAIKGDDLPITQQLKDKFCSLFALGCNGSEDYEIYIMNKDVIVLDPIPRVWCKLYGYDKISDDSFDDPVPPYTVTSRSVVMEGSRAQYTFEVRDSKGQIFRHDHGAGDVEDDNDHTSREMRKIFRNLDDED